MKRILFVLLLLPLFANSQTLLQEPNTAGYIFQNIGGRDRMAMPSDTFTIAVAYRNRKWFARIGTTNYYWNTTTHIWEASAGAGTVTNVSALTLGTTGTDLSSSVANSTTTPVITLNVPTASASNRGALSAADWITFNSKGSGTVTSVGLTMPSAFSVAGSPVTTSGTLAVTGAGTTSQYIRGDGSLATYTGGVMTASNGLTVASNNVKLGGTLIDATTTLDGGGTKNFHFDGIKGFEIGSYAAGNYIYMQTMGVAGQIARVDQDSARWVSTVVDGLNTSVIDQRVDDIYITSNNGDIEIEGANTLLQESGGEVGIGNASPVARLTIGTAGGLLGSISVAGNTSGVITMNPQAAAGTYNWNWPTTAGTTGQFFTSGGGGASPNTWTTPSTATTIYSGDGTLAGNRSILTSAFTLTINSTSAATLTSVNGAAGDGINAYANGAGNGLLAQSTSGFGITASTSTGTAAANFSTTPTATNTTTTVMNLNKFTSGTAANNIGGSIDYYVETDGGSGQISNQLISKWTTAANATRTSQFIITGVNSATTGDILTLNGNKSIKANGYGAGTFTGTATKFLAVDADGDIIEEDAPSGGGWGTTGTVATLTGTSTLAMATNTFNFSNGSVGIKTTPGLAFHVDDQTGAAQMRLSYGANVSDFRQISGGGLRISSGNGAIQFLDGVNAYSLLIANAAVDNGIILEAGSRTINTYSGTGAIVLTDNSTSYIGVGAADASAKLGVSSTTQGFLPPRMTTTQKNAISSPTEGLMVYDLTLHKLCVYTGSAWETITSL